MHQNLGKKITTVGELKDILNSILTKMLMWSKKIADKTYAFIAFSLTWKMLDSLPWKRAFYITLPWEGRNQE